MTIDNSDSRVFAWISGADVQPLRVDWWETHLIPRGCLTVLAGRGNSGKSTTAAAWAAEETRRGGLVVWLHSEESRELHIIPKLHAAGAIVDRVRFLDVKIKLEDGTLSDDALRLPRDIKRLEAELVDMGVRFLVLDALTSFKPSQMSSNSGDDVRAFLEPIQQLADRLGAVILGIAHLGKDGERKARDAVKGASEWTDVPRQTLAFHREDDETEGVISDVKGNLSPSPRSIGYRFENVTLPEFDIVEVGRITFTGDVDTNVDQARRTAVPDDDSDDRSDALKWVEDYLEKEGETDAAVVKRACAKALMVSVRTVERSIRAPASRVVSVSKDFPRKAYWRLADFIDGEVISSDTSPSASSDDTPITSTAVATVATSPDQAKPDVATGVATSQTPSSDTGQNSASTQRPTACRVCNISLPATATTDVCDICEDPVRRDKATPPPFERQLRVVHDGRASRAGQSPICPHCGDPLIYEDDRKDGFHTSVSKCVRAHGKATA